MKSNSELTIIIPAKNERLLLPRLLESITRQDYPLLSRTRVFVADAGSTDGTVPAAFSFLDRLDLHVIDGGLPAVGRNNGARQAQSDYVLFIDADVELADRTIVRRSVNLMKQRQLHCATTNIWCQGGNFRDNVLYAGSNASQWLSRLAKPFSTGMYMLFDRQRFFELGGFHEGALYAEDYLLSKQVARKRFTIVPGSVLTTNRRFQKMGHWKIVRMFLRTALNTGNEAYFLQDQHYWTS